MISKAQAGYIVVSGLDVLCEECAFAKDLPKGALGCAYMGPSVTVSASAGSCNRYKSGPRDSVPWLAPYFTKVELGYAENKRGFGCRRCKEFKPGHDDCEEVKRSTPGATPGLIDPYGCCDFWDRDSVRGNLTNQQLTVILSSEPGTGKTVVTGRRT